MRDHPASRRALQTLAKLLAIALACALVAVSIWLAPAPPGAAVGTEPALFGPCPLGTEGPLRCPTCGMTGAVSCMARGRWLEACRRNLLAPLLVFLVLFAACASLRSLVTRTPLLAQPGALWLTSRLPLIGSLAAVLYLVMQLAGI